MDLFDFLIHVTAGEIDAQALYVLKTFIAIEELVEWDPEEPLVIAVLEVCRADGVFIPMQLSGDECGVPAGDDGDIAIGLRGTSVRFGRARWRSFRSKTAGRPRIIRGDGSHAGDSGPGETQVSVALMSRFGGRRVFEREDDDRERRGAGAGAEVRERGAAPAVDVVFDKFDLAKAGVALLIFEAGRIDAGGSQNVIEQASGGIAWLDSPGSLSGEIFESGEREVDVEFGLKVRSECLS
jgi:hypothetical protein